MLQCKKGFSVLPLVLAGMLAAHLALADTATTTVLNLDQAKNLASTVLSKIAQGQSITIQDFSVYNAGLYKVKLQVKDSSGTIMKNSAAIGDDANYFNSYMTTDGKQFFVSGIDIDGLLSATATPSTVGTSTPPTATVVPKTAKPTVQLFVMSYCPYGLQIEKGIIPVVKALGSTINFKLEYVSYSMHGNQEMLENLRDVCLAQTVPTKYLDYISCFASSDGTAGAVKKCFKAMKISKAEDDKFNTCTKQTDDKFTISKNMKTGTSGSFPAFNVNKADNDKYGVQGSPTLVINGVQFDAGRDSASLLTAICNAFTTKPAACNKTMSSVSPDPGFGSSSGNSAGAASCNPTPAK